MSSIDVARPDFVSSPRSFVKSVPTKRVALVGGFRPIKCGIATFTTDFYEQANEWLKGHSIDVYAMVPTASTTIDPAVTATIVQHDIKSYLAAAEQMNESGVDVVWIQHEFGIFGGDAGEMITHLMAAVAAPLVITLHTVLESPSPQQRAVMEKMKAKATRFVVMSQCGRDMLISTYGVAAGRVHVVEHGAPDRPHVDTNVAREMIGLPDRPTIMTFGLLGPGKGLETAIRAMPTILREHPDVVYRIVGATHPNLVAAEGEAYRNSLKMLAAELGVAANIEWVERFLDTDELLDQLAGCDIYLTPYPNLAQSTSGTLAYAVALGCAVVSTPYVHAREILANGVGVLVPPHEPERIAEEIVHLLADSARLAASRRRAYERGRSTVWSEFAARTGEIIAAVMPKHVPVRSAFAKPAMPSTQAFLSLVDDVGIIQHCLGIVPDRNHGYCIDDNARALILVNQLGEQHSRLAPRFAAFLQHAWNGDSHRFRNFMGYDRRWLESVGSEDSNGRAIWAIGHTANQAEDARLRQWAVELFDRAAPYMLELESLRTMAFLVLGAQQILLSHPDNVCAKQLVDKCAARLRVVARAGTEGSSDWPWCEKHLSYDNVRIPQALMILSDLTGDRSLGDAGAIQLSWLYSMHTTPKGFFRPLGSEGFDVSFGSRPFDQQPLEAWAMIDACKVAMAVRPSDEWRSMAMNAYAWYLGRNDRGIVVGDPITGFCFDGLTALGVNANSGAESVLSFSLAYQSLISLASGQAEHEQKVSHARNKVGTL